MKKKTGCTCVSDVIFVIPVQKSTSKRCHGDCILFRTQECGPIYCFSFILILISYIFFIQRYIFVQLSYSLDHALLTKYEFN